QLTRRSGDDVAADIEGGYITGVSAPTALTPGTINGMAFISSAPSPFTVGTSLLTFGQLGSTYSADESTLHLSGTTFSAKDAGITLAKIANAAANSKL